MPREEKEPVSPEEALELAYAIKAHLLDGTLKTQDVRSLLAKADINEVSVKPPLSNEGHPIQVVVTHTGESVSGNLLTLEALLARKEKGVKLGHGLLAIPTEEERGGYYIIPDIEDDMEKTDDIAIRCYPDIPEDRMGAFNYQTFFRYEILRPAWSRADLLQESKADAIWTNVFIPGQTKLKKQFEAYVAPQKSMDELMETTDRKSWINIGSDIWAIPYPSREKPECYYIIPNSGSLPRMRASSLAKFYPEMNMDALRTEYKITQVAWIPGHCKETVDGGEAADRLDVLQVTPGAGKAVRADAEPDRPIDVFEGLPRHTLKIEGSGGGDLGNIVLIEHKDRFFLESINIHLDPRNSWNDHESMSALGKLAGLSFDPSNGGMNLYVHINDTMSYSGSKLPAPFLPIQFPAAESGGLWVHSVITSYLVLCRSRGSVSGTENRDDEKSNITWQIGNGFATEER